MDAMNWMSPRVAMKMSMQYITMLSVALNVSNSSSCSPALSASSRQAMSSSEPNSALYRSVPSPPTRS